MGIVLVGNRSVKLDLISPPLNHPKIDEVTMDFVVNVHDIHR